MILCDRGMMDGKAYAGDENWAAMLHKVGVIRMLYRLLKNKS